MIKNLALFTTSYGAIISIESGCPGDLTQISEIVEVDFPDLPKDVLLNNQLAAIEVLIGQAKQEAIDKMDQLNQRKQELLAITHLRDYSSRGMT